MPKRMPVLHLNRCVTIFALSMLLLGAGSKSAKATLTDSFSLAEVQACDKKCTDRTALLSKLYTKYFVDYLKTGNGSAITGIVNVSKQYQDVLMWTYVVNLKLMANAIQEEEDEGLTTNYFATAFISRLAYELLVKHSNCSSAFDVMLPEIRDNGSKAGVDFLSYLSPRNKQNLPVLGVIYAFAKAAGAPCQ